MTDPLTTPDRADRARWAWELYSTLNGATLPSLIADLMHLADVDEHIGGGVGAARQAAAEYEAAQPTWPTGSKTPKYLGQIRPAGEPWKTVVEGDETTWRVDVAGCLWPLLQRNDFRTGEISAHVEDLARGPVLVAENGTAFRVITNPEWLHQL